MFSLSAPTLAGQDVFDACTPHTTNKILLDQLKRTSPSIAMAEDDLRTAINVGDASGYSKRARQPFACDGEQMAGLYGRVLRDGAQRPTYNSLVYAGRERACPICGASIAGTLDHYLPKSSFPELAVVPINLVPTCGPCNTDKKEHVPASADECLFHPFFDNWLAHPMLDATLVFNGGPRIEFHIRQPAGCPATTYRRALKTFEVYKLAKNLPVAAATHFRTVKANCSIHYGHLPKPIQAAAIEKWARTMDQELSAKNPNDWQAAMYRAFANSPPFLNGGYKLLPG